MKLIRNAVLAASVLLAACTTGTTRMAEEIPLGRLPQGVTPLAYALDFTMDPRAPGFSGHTEIQVNISQPLNAIWMHGKNFDISSAELVTADGRRLAVKYQQVHDDGVVKLTLPETVSPQVAILRFDYSAEYPQGLDGPYKVTDNGEQYIFTQFEAVAARKAFPSFDEPAFKTPFTLSFTIPAQDNIVANTPETKSEPAGAGWKKVDFMTTKALPTYLVAWAIGPLDIVDGPVMPPNAIRDRAVPLRGVATKGKGKMMKYALDNTPVILEGLEEYFGIPYPYEKLDLIAVPDFAAGAMENAGAITYREILLLIDPVNSPDYIKRYYAAVNAHEIAHQWFGNLVTMPWWDDIWLNESFASWAEGKVIEKAFPEHKPELDKAAAYRYAMSADSLITARQIRNPVRNSDDIQNAFDGITYSKGEAVLTMFENYVSKDNWQKGIQLHLKRHAFGNADVNDFLDSISEASGKDIREAFKTFLFQPGLPFVAVTPDCVNGEGILHLDQSRYLPVGSAGDRDAQSWQIPVCAEYQQGKVSAQACTMLKTDKTAWDLPSKGCPAWVMPNDEGLGYYQWSLPATDYRNLQTADALSVLDELSLAFSIQSAFRSAALDTAETMELLLPMAKSENHDIAERPMSIVNAAHQELVPDDMEPMVEAFARKLYGNLNVAKDFGKGKAPADAREREFRAGVAEFLAETGKDQSVRKAASEAGARVIGFKNGKPDFKAIAPEYLPLALSMGVREYGKPYFDAVLQIFRTANNPFLRIQALNALSSTRDPELGQQLLDMVIAGDELRLNELETVLRGQMSEERRDVTWQWFKANFDNLVARIPPDVIGGSSYVAIASLFCSNERAEETQAFFEPYVKDIAGGPRQLAQTVERIRLCAALKEAQSPSARAYFGG